VALFAALFGLATAQDPQPRTDAGAFRLPDGTVVFFTKNPDEPNPKIDGVLLSPKEYQTLLEQAEQFKKAKESARPVPPSEVHIRGKVDLQRDRPFATLQLTYAFRTTTPRAVVALGCQRAFLASAVDSEGKLPLLASGADGLTVLVDRPGEYTLTLTVEVPVGPRGGKGEVGFEFGLPRAAITTLALEPPGPDVKTLTIATRTADITPAKGGETKRVTEDAARYASKPDAPGPPLGPIESLEVTWEAPAAAAPAAAETPTSLEADVVVRVEESQLETTTRLRLRGPPREWTFVFPPGPLVNVTVERVGMTTTGRGPPTITRPGQAGETVWTVQTPDSGEWIATVTTRQTRLDASDSAPTGPYPIGPFFAREVPRQSGTIRVYAPVTLKPTAAAPREVRRQDVPSAPPAAAEDAPVLVYRYATPPMRDGEPLPLLDLTIRRAVGAVLVQPIHNLRLTEAGWRMRSEIKVTPVRQEIHELKVQLPVGWQTPDVLPPELVEEVPEVDRQLLVRLAAPQTAPFDLVLEATWPVPPMARESTVLLPRFPGAVERGSQMTISVPDGFTVHGTAHEGDGKQPADYPIKLRPPTPTGAAAVTTLAGKFDMGVTHVDLEWGPFRPELTANVRADMTLHDRQAEIVQTIHLAAAGGLPRIVKLKGPPAPPGFRGPPSVEPIGSGEWAVNLPSGEKEATITFSYAAAIPSGTASGVALPLIWPDATRVEVMARVWTTGRRVERFTGPWREMLPEPDPERDSLPILTLTGTGTGLPLAFDLLDATDGISPVVIDRAAIEAVTGPDGTVQVRGRFILTRWPATGVEVEVPAGAALHVRVERKQVQPVATTHVGDVTILRISLPHRPMIELDVRYAPPPMRNRWSLGLTPPQIRGALVRMPMRWQVVVPTSLVPLVPDEGFIPDVWWQWRGWGFAPVPGTTPTELDAWLIPSGATATDAANGWGLPEGEILAGRQAIPGRLRVIRVPRAGWVLGCSVMVFLVGLAVSRLRPGVLGVAVALLGTTVAIAAVAFPQPAAQAAAAAQPGLVVLLIVWITQAARRWYHRHRVTHLPTFARGSLADRPTASAAGSAVPGKSSRNGSAAEVPAKTGSTIPPLTPAGPG
jgi:hypothetical protein